jgi:hypothetical protein
MALPAESEAQEQLEKDAAGAPGSGVWGLNGAGGFAKLGYDSGGEQSGSK